MAEKSGKNRPHSTEPPERPKHDPRGRDHEVHKRILERRMQGGREPTPDDYSRALEQWKKLPGSIVRPPTDITPEDANRPEEGGNDAGADPQDSGGDRR